MRLLRCQVVVDLRDDKNNNMYIQSFSPKALYACTTQAERRNSGLNKKDFIEAIGNELGNSIVDGTYNFQIKQEGGVFLNRRRRKDFDYLCQNLILRKLHNNIKAIYKVQQADRNTIVRQMKMLLNENVKMWVVRLDVRHFYESINRERLINKFTEDGRLSYPSITLLRALFKEPVVAAGIGMPRGLGVSAAMSELYMKYFDLAIRRVEGVYYYARFVDDIIVFCSSERSKNLVWVTAQDYLSSLGLELNSEKSYSWCSSAQRAELVYLGYTFKKSVSKVDVSISGKKIKLIKTRITKSFVRFAKDRNFILLKLRIKFLTGNFTLYQADALLPIKVGLYYNYKLATNTECLDELDKYYQRLLHCKTGKLGSRIALTKPELKDLEKYSFRFGYENHVNHHFTNDQIGMVTNCWL